MFLFHAEREHRTSNTEHPTSNEGGSATPHHRQAPQAGGGGDAQVAGKNGAGADHALPGVREALRAGVARQADLSVRLKAADAALDEVPAGFGSPGRTPGAAPGARRITKAHVPR